MADGMVTEVPMRFADAPLLWTVDDVDSAGECAQLVGLNERFRYYRYRPGQKFAPHMDHWHKLDDQTLTLLTVLVYFNGDFQGGETRFLEQIEQTVVPVAGRAAIFQHKIRHEGCPVVSGTKYALRTDVIYRAPSPIALTYA